MTTALTPINMTAEWKRKWIETRSAVLWDCPAFTHILFSMLNPTNGELAALFTDKVPVAATDGTNLILNPEAFFKYKLMQRVFITAHEIAHCMFNHCALGYQMRRTGQVKYQDGSSLPYDQKLMNMAMDFVINSMLVESKIGEMPEDALYDPTLATSKDSFLDVYKKVYEQQEKSNKGKASAPGNGKSGFDQHLDPGAGQGQDPGQSSQARSETEWNTAIAGALASAKAQGKLPAALERLLSAVIEPEVSWQDHIRGFFARKLGSGGYDWRKPDRRLITRDIIAPARAGNGCGPVVVAIDTSGSIGQRELDVFFAEMKGLLDDVRPEVIHVLWCDAEVHRADEVTDSSDIDTLKPVGGGGTDFRPVFDWIDEQDFTPDALVYLTDGYGTFPTSEPKYPLVWGAIAQGVTYPFGEVVPVPIKSK